VDRTLRYVGLGILAAAVWLVLADAAGWLPEGLTDTWTMRAVYTGGALVLAGFLYGALAGTLRRLTGGRCVRCGAPIGRGQAYCWDHLQETVNEYRDQNHDGPRRRAGTRS
jgi:hypothetical protein